MFKNNQKQFINILKQDKQLKVDYKTILNEKILKQEQSSFLIQDNNMPKDGLYKLNSLQKEIPNTYLTSLYTAQNQSIQIKDNVDTTSFETVSLNNQYCIAIAKNDILKHSNYFKDSGIDYLISPFSILNEYFKSYSTDNSLNLLIYNNTLYLFILDKDKEIVFGDIKQLTAFENIQDSNFYNDDTIGGQMLYDEVHFLEIQQYLNETIEKFYQENENVDFLELVNILHTVKQLSDEQLESLHDTVMIKINYNAISIDDYLYQLAQKPNALNYSFTGPRSKKNDNSAFVWLLLVLFSVIGVSAVLYYNIPSTDSSQSKKVDAVSQTQVQKSKEIKQPKETVKKEIIKLPNHNLKNNQIVQQTLMLFNLIPYNGILKELEIEKNSSTFVCNFVTNSTTLESMKEQLKKLYKESKTLLKYENNAILSTIISNSELLNIDKSKTQEYLTYQEHEFISISKMTQYLQSIVIKDSKVQFTEKQKTTFMTYNFSIISVVQTPKEFFDFIEILNTKEFPINITYPLEFAKLKDGIEVKYNLQFHQQNKASVKPQK